MDNILNKIQKLLNLSKSSNPNEAASALRMARTLMQKHNVSMSDVELSTIDECSVSLKGMFSDRKIIGMLSTIIMKCFNIKCLCRISGNRIVKITFVGEKTSIELATYAFTYLSRQMLNVKKEYTLTAKYDLKMQYRVGDSSLIPTFQYKVQKTVRAYMIGWLEKIRIKVQDFANDDDKMKLIENYLNKKYNNLKETKTRRSKFNNFEYNALTKGYNDADKVNLFKPMNGCESAKIGYNYD